MARTRILRQLFLDSFRSVPPAPHRPTPASWSNEKITGACLGHSTVLLNFLGSWVLTDPVFSMRAGPGWSPFVLGPKRYLRPALSIRELPKIDLIVLSHAHFDHFDLSSLRHFPRDTQIVTARHTSDLLRRFHHVHELHWNQTLTLKLQSGSIAITGIEVKHWGARMLRDEHRGYNGYVLEKSGRRVFYSGDTAMTDAFRHLGANGQNIDLILMPIGAYDPWIRAHCNPEQAHAMAEAAGAKHFVPVHHQTFKLSSERMDEPAHRIRAAFASEPERLLSVDVGETFVVPIPAA
ncbi:MAG: MBL fold metallo-hydrolase [Chthoniobacterales bacterium]